MEPLEHLTRWLAEPNLALLTDATLRLCRLVPEAQAMLDAQLTDPIERALAGVDTIDPASVVGLRDQVRAAIAAAEGSGKLDAVLAASLEARAQSEAPELWPVAARASVLVSEERERAARVLLSIQDLPYAFPGEVNAVQVAIFAAGDRVLPALHVDWARKLTGLACDALKPDLSSQGLWAWPALQVMEARQLTRQLRRLLRRRHRLPPGGAGLAVAYLEQVGTLAPMELSGADGLLLDLARATRQHTDR
ncbi:MAG: hypothetical protein ACI8S6_001864 [Myxococcota bacterium]|jgi:hypothetical protein